MNIQLRVVIFVFFACMANTAIAGKIVVNHDEWTLSNAGFVQSPDATTERLHGPKVWYRRTDSGILSPDLQGEVPDV